MAPKGPLQCKRCQRFGHTPQCVACRGSHLWWVLYPVGAASVLWLWVNHTANYGGCIKWKEAKAALAKQAPDRAPKELRRRPPRRSESSASEGDGPGRGVEPRRPRGRVVNATTTPTPNPNPPSAGHGGP